MRRTTAGQYTTSQARKLSVEATRESRGSGEILLDEGHRAQLRINRYNDLIKHPSIRKFLSRHKGYAIKI